VVEATFSQMTYVAFEVDKSVEVCVTLNGMPSNEVEILLFTGDLLLIKRETDDAASGDGANSEFVPHENPGVNNVTTLAMPELDYISLCVPLVFATQGTLCRLVKLVEDFTIEDDEVFKMVIEGDIMIQEQSAYVIIHDSDGELVR
jgi:hypothetical protein